MQHEIMVSICCITYNHEKYIAKAIESFLMQETDFEFEILIHDDASRDSTQKIIKEYSDKYEQIKPILQQENQLSKGISALREYLFPNAKGKYIALCEGDDYWIDPHKLQRQVDYMESNPDCTLVFHNAIIVNTNEQIIKQSFLPKNSFYADYFEDKERIYSCEDMILLDFAPTNSMLFRTINVRNLPPYFDNGVCGDLPMRLYTSSLGYAYYFPEKMSAYRKGVEGSASQRAVENYESRIKVLWGHLKILNDFNKSTAYKYDNAISKAKDLKIFSHYYMLGTICVCNSKEYKKILRKGSVRQRIGFYLRAIAPRLFDRIWKFIERLNNYNRRSQ